MILHYLKLLAKTPSKRLLLADSLGAALTLGLLSTMALWGSDLVGIPKNHLYLLAAVALLLALISFISYRVAGGQWPTFLTGITIANVGYCLLTLIVLYLSRHTVSIYGWLYFGIEITVILALATHEYRMAKASLASPTVPTE